MKILEKNLDIVKDILRKDMDFFMVVDGYEGLGKTTLALEICDYVDDDFSLDKLAFTGEEFVGVLRRAEPYSTVLLDEGGTVLFSRRAMDEANKRLVELLMAIRAKNLFFCLCLPNIFWLDVYARKHRVGALAHVTKRGRFSFYSKKRIGQMMKENIYGRPNFTESFKSLDGNELWEQYKTKKLVFVDSRLDNQIKYSKEFSREDCLTPREIGRIMGKDVQTVYGWMTRGLGGSKDGSKPPNPDLMLHSIERVGNVGNKYVRKKDFYGWREKYEKYMEEVGYEKRRRLSEGRKKYVVERQKKGV